jgi:kumamolisin
MVTAVTGLTNYVALPPVLTNAVNGDDGVTTAQMTTFYDMAPLRSAGLDGSGETVMFPELAAPPPSVLGAFATQFHLPPFQVTYRSDVADWGAPVTPNAAAYEDSSAEASLDLEVVHGLAPGAKEVVYETSGEEPMLSNAISAMVKQDPTGIISSSLGAYTCDNSSFYDQQAEAESAVFEPAAALGMSIVWASGDRGAYECNGSGPGQPQILSVLSEDNSPYITSVGGTTVFLSTTGAYYKEAAWGEPLDQWGGTGGFSPIFARPVWQKGPGLAGVTKRGIPDVSADADPDTNGWAIFAPGPQGQPLEEPVGGTSASTPCWAAVIALIDEDLALQHLPRVGFANPALYYFGSDPKGLPAPAFHEITAGTNLYYAAVPGWNAATGLGSPDVAHLADDFEWYYRTHQNGA